MKKAAFLFISGVLFTSMMALAQAPSKPSLKGPTTGPLKPLQPPIVTIPDPKVIDDKITIAVDKKTKFIIGDWNSSGSPQAPYVPPYPYQYQCQVQITDSVYREEAGEPYRHFVIADFELNEKSSFVNSDTLQWVGQKYFSTQKVLPTDEPAPFEYSGQFIGMAMKPKQKKTEDIVILYASLNQKAGPLVFSDNEQSLGTRQSSYLDLTMSLQIQNVEDPKYPRLMMRILCEKVK
ncbi:MAG: hypothetical protein ACXWC9_02025 [Pseudobdellovibrionaceae bacterium]